MAPRCSRCPCPAPLLAVVLCRRASRSCCPSSGSDAPAPCTRGASSSALPAAAPHTLVHAAARTALVGFRRKQAHAPPPSQLRLRGLPACEPPISVALARARCDRPRGGGAAATDAAALILFEFTPSVLSNSNSRRVRNGNVDGGRRGHQAAHYTRARRATTGGANRRGPSRTPSGRRPVDCALDGLRRDGPGRNLRREGNAGNSLSGTDTVSRLWHRHAH